MIYMFTVLFAVLLAPDSRLACARHAADADHHPARPVASHTARACHASLDLASSVLSRCTFCPMSGRFMTKVLKFNKNNRLLFSEKPTRRAFVL
jgi:hypothetical protein